MGHGVFTLENCDAGELLLEYRGKLRQNNHETDIQDTTFLYYFEHERKSYFIDATNNSSIARMANDIDYATKANCKMKKVVVNGVPRLGLFALNEISKGTELRYDYGDKLAPWRKQQKNHMRPALYRQPRSPKREHHFVCSGSIQTKDQLKHLVSKFGGRYMEEFDNTVTHVIMETKERGCRICSQTLKLFLGIAHHCWILDYEYIYKSIEAGYYLPEDEYEIMGSEDIPSCSGPAISRQTMTPILRGYSFKFSGESKDLSKDVAEDIVLALGGQIGGGDAQTISLDENGGQNTVSRDWLFDMLCFYQYLEPESYIHKNSSDRNTFKGEEQSEIDTEQSFTHNIVNRNIISKQLDTGTEAMDTQNLLIMNLKAPEVPIIGTEILVAQKLVDLDTEQFVSPILSTEEQYDLDTEQSVKQELDDGNLKAKEQLDIKTEKYFTQNIASMNLNAREQSNTEGSQAQNMDTESHFEEQSLTDTELSDVSNLDSSYFDDSNDEDYFPSQVSENEYDFSESESTIYPVQNYGFNKIVISPKHDNNNCESDESTTQVLDIDKVNNPIPTLSVRDIQCDETEIGVNIEHQTVKIAISKKTKDGKRVWDKKHACTYCKKQYPKLARHLEQVHANEIDVQRALAFNKNSKERKEVWREIMNRGDFEHNVDVLEKQQGEIIPFKRPSRQVDGLKYVQCATCFGTFRSSVLWRHVKNSHPESVKKTTKLKKHHQVSSAALLPVAGVVADKFRDFILNRMANDKVSLVARNDNDIVRFGQKMFQKTATNHHQNQYVRQKMRELARFLVSVRAIDNTVTTLRDCINSIKFSACVKAVKELCEYNEDDFTFKIPSLAKKIGHSLHKVARQVRTEAAKTGDGELRRQAKSFIEVYIEDWETEISHFALQTLETEKYNKPKRIPLAQDLKALTTYLKKEAAILLDLFDSDQASDTEWRELCKVTLAETVLFNKRRSGEAERLEVKQYLDGIQHGKNSQEEVLQSLSPLEKKLSEIVDRIEIRGKRGRKVAILVHHNLRKQLDTLVKNRTLGCIDESNKYVFARPGDAEFPMRAADVLRKYANECGAKQPELLNSTSFRKHIAVIVQMLNLKDNELDVLADFLGHDIRVHREFYRLPQDTMQVAKISKILLEMEKGNIQQYKGKSLDEIEFDLEETLEPEQVSDDDGDEKDINMTTPTTSNTTIPKPTNERVKISGKRKMWTSSEEASVKKHLGKFLYQDKLPGKNEIEKIRKEDPILSQRPWIQIKSYIKNKKVSMKKKTREVNFTCG
ncbi:uncharacterized protein LOC132745869 isoform X2 [Ruditapes philippinarum]|uniref:uncharacterized protein LOC132745869 isoform X2 n=1 Tax=Ruditapes philippinarum TaxID=129788 RepID=UPI00295B98F1|nr:uncharacterized protein LOC132745869 isoform X2 [Ruditapes philippinarum]